MTQEDPAGRENTSALIYEGFFGNSEETGKNKFRIKTINERTFTLILSVDDLVRFKRFCDILPLVDVSDLDSNQKSDLLKLCFDAGIFISDNTKISFWIAKSLGDTK